jgi:hypothetical protein
MIGMYSKNWMNYVFSGEEPKTKAPACYPDFDGGALSYPGPPNAFPDMQMYDIYSSVAISAIASRTRPDRTLGQGTLARRTGTLRTLQLVHRRHGGPLEL